MDDKFNSNIASNSLLSREKIILHMKAGNIVIDQFDSGNLGTVSYDVTLGKYFYREQNLSQIKSIYSPYDEADVKSVWGLPQIAQKASILFKKQGLKVPKGIKMSDEVILIGPGETILAHTQEFIGGQKSVTTMMKARSSLGRNFIAVCKCAGWGDLGYINRWTMEITNFSKNYAIPLVVGRRIAQMAFFQVDEIISDDYVKSGKYQTNRDLRKLKKSWVPSDMLPKMWKDKEVTKR